MLQKKKNDSVYLGSCKVRVFHLYCVGFYILIDSIYMGSCKVGVFHVYLVGFDRLND